MKSFAGRSAYPVGLLNGLGEEVVFLWFTRDHDTVDQDAALREWRDAFREQEVGLIYVDATYVGLLEAPTANVAAHELALG